MTLRVVLLFGLLLAASSYALGQQPRIPSSVAQPQGTADAPVTSGDDIQQQQARAANQQRQVEIRRDMDKLSELVQQLKDDLTKNGGATISADALKKAELIEKLAHSVKSKMKQSF
jgi:hypothetical protein